MYNAKILYSNSKKKKKLMAEKDRDALVFHATNKINKILCGPN